MGFLGVILIIILAFWLLGVIGRWLLRLWLLRKQREFAERFGGNAHAGGYHNGPKARPEGDVDVRQTARIEKKVNRNVGDYVEFEEEVDD